MATKNIVQKKDSKTGKYLKIDRKTGQILATKKTPGPYKDIPIMKKKDVSKTWKQVLKNRGTGEILDMRAVLK